MPIDNFPLTFCEDGVYRPFVPIRIINPHTNFSYRTKGLINTGADECAVPAFIAQILGHDLKKGRLKRIMTGNGETESYSHSTKFELFHPLTGELLYTTAITPVDYLPNLEILLLGVNNFLSEFILTMNCPAKTFSIKKP
jgi:hypothetical protein